MVYENRAVMAACFKSKDHIPSFKPKQIDNIDREGEDRTETLYDSNIFVKQTDKGNFN